MQTGSDPSNGLHAALLEMGAALGRNGPDLFVLLSPEVETVLAERGRPRGSWTFVDRITQREWLALPGCYDPALPLRALSERGLRPSQD